MDFLGWSLDKQNTIYGLDNTYDPDILVTMVNVEGTQTVFAVWSYDTNGDGTPDVQDES